MSETTFGELVEEPAKAKGEILAEGKTKIIREKTTKEVKITSKNDITAGDGLKHDIIEGKAELATTTTCNVFRLLKACGIQVAFNEQVDRTSFSAPRCEMLPYEVVIRREAHGSYLKRAPHLVKGHIFPQLVLEFFLKTSGRKWKDQALICDDPLMLHHGESGTIDLFDPKQPDLAQAPAKPFLSLQERNVFSHKEELSMLQTMGDIAKLTFLVLERAWQLQGQRLVDFKVEFGIDPDGNLLLADVIDNDSWRVLDGTGNYIDKQVYRDGGDLNTVTQKYREVAEITRGFNIPRQALIFWRGSDSDSLDKFDAPIDKLRLNSSFVLRTITCSAHKRPAEAYRQLQKIVRDFPDSVVVAAIGRSNGAGPTLSANTMVPVITVPMSVGEFPDDVWSSLRTPSKVPVMTILEPANATLAALKILAIRNPGLYASLRFDLEDTLSPM